MTTTLRNLVIVLAIAALIVLIPGGGSGANVAFQAVALAFLAVIGWFAYTMYRQHRIELDSLGSGRRAILYGAAGVAMLTVTAEPRLWQQGRAGGKIVFVLLLGAAGYAAFAVIRSARRY
jgi:hypothetical protein